MNRLLLTLYLVLCSISLMPQSKEYSRREAVDRFNELRSVASSALSEEDYILAEKHIGEGIAFYHSLPSALQDKFEVIQAGNYYMLSRIYSLQQDKEKAIENFTKAVDMGFTNYMYAMRDTAMDNIRSEKRFVALMDKIRPLGDYFYILKQGGEYRTENDTPNRPLFVYEPADSKPLQMVRDYFKLDSIAGNGDEISRIKNMMTWVHNAIPHTGNGWPVSEITAIDIYNYSKANNNKSLNCEAIATVLNECYLSMGFKSRIVSCRPKKENDMESHVINCVYSTTLKKWLWMDATFNAYFTDEDGNLLSIAEVRQHLVDDKPLMLNKDANWNNKIPQTIESYVDNYMARFLYQFSCPLRSVFNSKSDYRDTDEEYMILVPVGHNAKDNTGGDYITHDAEYFWQAPDL